MLKSSVGHYPVLEVDIQAPPGTLLKASEWWSTEDPAPQEVIKCPFDVAGERCDILVGRSIPLDAVQCVV